MIKISQVGIYFFEDFDLVREVLVLKLILSESTLVKA